MIHRMLILLGVLLVLFTASAIADTFHIPLADGRNADCIGVVNLPTAKTFKVSMTEFKNHTSYYTDQIKQGNTVNIVNYGGSSYQIIKL